MSEGVSLRERAGGKARCAYCREQVSADAAPCPSCSTVLHDGCWSELEACPTFGCASPTQEPVREGVMRGYREARRRGASSDEPRPRRHYYLAWQARLVIPIFAFAFAQRLLLGALSVPLATALAIGVASFVGLYLWRRGV